MQALTDFATATIVTRLELLHVSLVKAHSHPGGRVLRAIIAFTLRRITGYYLTKAT